MKNKAVKNNFQTYLLAWESDLAPCSLAFRNHFLLLFLSGWPATRTIPHLAAVCTYCKDFKTLDYSIFDFLKILTIYHPLLTSTGIVAEIHRLSLYIVNKILVV